MRRSSETSTVFPFFEDIWHDLIVVGDDGSDTIVVDFLQPVMIVEYPSSFTYHEYFGVGSAIFVSSGSGDDTITVTDVGDSYIDTGDGADTITVDHAIAASSIASFGSPPEVTSKPSGVSVINSGSGADTISVTDAHSVSIDSGEGADSVVLHFAVTSFEANYFGDIVNEGEFLGAASVALGGGHDELAVFDAAQVVVSGGGGNDIVEISHGIDYDGGAYGGVVAIGEYFARGESWVSGGTGNDILSIELALSATVNGGAGNDLITVEHGTDSVYEEAGFTTTITHTSTGISTIDGGAGHDIIKVSNALHSVITGGRGADRISVAIENRGEQSTYVITDLAENDTFVFRSNVYDDLAALDAVAAVSEIADDVWIEIPGSGDFADTTIILEGVAGTGDFATLADLADFYILSF